MPKITSWMNKSVTTVKAAQSVHNVAVLMQKHKIGSVIVIEDNKPIGIFTERDLLNKVVAEGRNTETTKISDVMTREIKTAPVTSNYQEIYDLMTSNNIRHLPIVENKVLVAIVSMRDLLRYNHLKRGIAENISAWMIKTVVTVEPGERVRKAAMLMKRNNIGSVVVVKNKEPIGIFTERDIMTKVIAPGKSCEKTKINKVMTANIKTATISAGYRSVYDLMTKNNIRHLPIVENKKLIAIVSIRDLLRFNLRSLELTIAEQARELNFLRGILVKTNDDRNKELYMQNERLQGLVMVDSLTGLYNHKYFEEILIKEISRAKRYNRPVVLLFIDIDYFKHYNDVNGHEMGNLVLKKLAELLQQTSRHSDTLLKVTPIDTVARYGGEEFVIILPETDKKGGMVRAKRLLDGVRGRSFYNAETQPEGKLTVSIGVAQFPEDASAWDDLIKKADDALYKAKKNGRNQVVSN